MLTPDPLSTLALATGGAFLGKFVGPAAEGLGKAAWERAQQVAAKATALLAAVGREPQPVEPKLLLPLVQATSLETDQSLVDRWAALLANAADPAQRVQIRVSFTEILRQLTPIDAQVLALVYQQAEIDFTSLTYSPQLVQTNRFCQELDLAHEELSISLDELARLKLCDANFLKYTKMLEPTRQTGLINTVYPTVFGYQFLLAVTPPTS